MDLLEDESAAPFPDFNHRFDVSANFIRRAVGKHSLRIAAPAPKDHFTAELGLQFSGIHARAGYLNRVDRIQSRVDEVGQ